MSSLFIGGDPGVRGALVAIDGSGAYVGSLPLAKGVDDAIFGAPIIEWFDSMLHIPGEAVFALEKAQSGPRQKPSAMLNYGEGYGILKGVAMSYGLNPILVRPTIWKKAVLRDLPHDKGGAICYCKEHLPGLNLRLERCRTDHDGLADAGCIATYAWKYLNNW